MKVKIPFIGFVDETIQADFVQAFLYIFRDTLDKHRMLVVIPLVLLISHSVYLANQPHLSVIFYRLTAAEELWLFLAGLLILFVFSWAVFSSPFSPALYVRQTVFIVWTGLLHRLAYGLETLGTTYITAVSFLALSSFLPFAFTGKTVPQLFNQIKDDYQARKNAEPAIIEIQKNEPNAA